MSNNVLAGVMGLIVADALGVPVEFKNRESLRINPVVSMGAFGTYNQPAGTWSDDSSSIREFRKWFRLPGYNG